MIGRTNACATGSSLTYTVVGADSQPSTPANNTIWVKTTEPIVGHIFSSTQPAGVPGVVWFQTGTASAAAMDATAGNIIMVYPLHCKQYISGAWVQKPAKSYINNAWVDWITYLFESGEGPTTGWTQYASSGTGATIAAEKISLKGTGQSYEMGSLVKRTARLDLTGISTLYFNVQRLAGCTTLDCGVCATDPTSLTHTFTAHAAQVATGTGLLEVDVSALSGEHTVAVYSGAAAYENNDVAYVFDIYYT